MIFQNITFVLLFLDKSILGEHFFYNYRNNLTDFLQTF